MRESCISWWNLLSNESSCLCSPVSDVPNKLKLVSKFISFFSYFNVFLESLSESMFA